MKTIEDEWQRVEKELRASLKRGNMPLEVQEEIVESSRGFFFLGYGFCGKEVSDFFGTGDEWFALKVFMLNRMKEVVSVDF